MRRSAMFLLSLATFIAIAVLGPAARAQAPTPSSHASKLGPIVKSRAARAKGWSHVIIRATHAASVGRVGNAIERVGGKLGRALPLSQSRVAYVPDAALTALAEDPEIEQISLDRRTVSLMERTGAAIRATDVRQSLGFDGAGVGVGDHRFRRHCLA